MKTVAAINLSTFGTILPVAQLQLLTGEPGMKNTLQQPKTILPQHSEIQVKKKMDYEVPANSLSVIRIKTKK